MDISDEDLRVMRQRSNRVLTNGTTSGSARALAKDNLRLVTHLEKARKPRRKAERAAVEVRLLNALFEKE